MVDPRDRVVGSSTVDECLARGLLHRAVAVVVARPDGRVLLQQRSRKDPWHPGKWTLSCTGHVRKGESYREAAVRELMEELGVEVDLKFQKRYLLPPMEAGGLTEHEWVALFTGESDAQLKIDPGELEGVREYAMAELQKVLDGDALTPDSVILLSEYLRTRT